MKILVVSYYFPPLGSVASLRPYSFAKAFAKMGHDVTVLTADKPSNSGDFDLPIAGFDIISVRSKMLEFLYRLLKINAEPEVGAPSRELGVVGRLKRFRLKRGVLLLGRMPDLLDLLYVPLRRAASRNDWDLVVSSYGPYVCHAVGYHLKRTGRCDCWVADFRDLWTRHHEFSGLQPFVLLERRLESKYLRAADVVTTVSDQLASVLREGTAGQKVHVVENGFDADELAEIKEANIFSDEKVRLVYTGTIYADNVNFERLLKAVKQAHEKRPNLADELQVVFAGADLGAVSKQVERMNLDDVVALVGMRPREEALRMQRDAHVLLFLDNEKSSGVNTGKLYEYLASGRVIWRVGSTPASDPLAIIERTKTGVNIGNDPGAICERILELSEAKRKPIRNGDQREIRKYERFRLAERLVSLVDGTAVG